MLRAPHRFLAIGVVSLVVIVGPALRVILEACGIGIPPIPFPYGRSLVYNLIAIVLALSAALWLGRGGPVVENLGLRWLGLRYPTLALLGTAPCWIGLAATQKVSHDFTALDLIFPALVFPFAEEFVFRGFGFIFSRRGLRWPIPASVLLQAVVFGVDHWIGAGAGGPVALQVFLITLIGGIFFAAIDAMSGYTIWSGWVVHCSINAAWTVFAVSDTAATGWLGNILRLSSILLTLVLIRRFRAPPLPASPASSTSYPTG
jgi:hypothetical protein